MMTFKVRKYRFPALLFFLLPTGRRQVNICHPRLPATLSPHCSSSTVYYNFLNRSVSCACMRTALNKLVAPTVENSMAGPRKLAKNDPMMQRPDSWVFICMKRKHELAETSARTRSLRHCAPRPRLVSSLRARQ